jgi:hypothetical protein
VVVSMVLGGHEPNPGTRCTDTVRELRHYAHQHGRDRVTV